MSLSLMLKENKTHELKFKENSAIMKSIIFLTF